MAVYNGERFLDLAIESIQRQTYDKYEFIIIDDGSDDNTWKVLSDYAQSDSRITLLRNKKNIGLTRSLAVGMKIARGEYIARQDADDISLPNRLERQKNYLDLDYETVLVSCGLYKIDSKGKLLKRYDLACDAIHIEWHLLFFNYLRGHGQVMFRRKAAEKAGGYRTYFKCAQDYDLWARLLKYGKINILPDKLLKYRIHRESISNKKNDLQLTFALEIAQRQLNNITNYPFNHADVEQLWSFWTVTELERKILSNKKEIARLQHNLNLVIDGFKKKNTELNSKDIIQIKMLIAERYIKWSILILMGKYPKHTFIVLVLNALKWAEYKIFSILVDISKQIHRQITIITTNH